MTARNRLPDLPGEYVTGRVWMWVVCVGRVCGRGRLARETASSQRNRERLSAVFLAACRRVVPFNRYQLTWIRLKSRGRVARAHTTTPPANSYSPPIRKRIPARTLAPSAGYPTTS